MSKYLKDIAGNTVCTKKPYMSKREAEGALRYLQLTMDEPQESTVYRCRFCSTWHLTSKKKKESKKIDEHYDKTLNKKNNKKKPSANLLVEKKKKRKRKKRTYPRNTLIGEQLKKLLNIDEV
jgi:hypothetical protein